MSVHYKFKSAKSYDIIPFEGSVISVRDLKMAIIEQKKLGTSGDFDLKFSNAQTKEGALVIRLSSLPIIFLIFHRFISPS